MTVADLMWLLLLLVVASSLFSSARPKAVMHDPISAILAGVLPEALGGLAAVAPEAGLAGGLGLGAVDAVLPELAVGALAPEVAGAGLEAGIGAGGLGGLFGGAA